MTYEQFKQLRAKGLTSQQIAEFEKRGKPATREVREPKSTFGERLREAPSTMMPALGEAARGLKESWTGGLKGVGSTLSGMSSLGQRGLEKTVGAGLRKFGIGDEAPRQTAGEIAKERFFTPKGQFQKGAFAAEQLGEFVAPSGAMAKLTKGKGLIRRTLAESGYFGGVSAAQEGEIGEKAKTDAIIGAMFPLGGSVYKKFGKGIIKTGEKIQQSVIRPSGKDIKDGFKIKNVSKYNLGGSLGETLAKTNLRMNQLSKQLKDKIKSSDKTINLDNVYKKTLVKMLKKPSISFGDIGSTKRILKSLKKEIEEAGGKSGTVNLVEAQAIKRGAGSKGAWVFGMADKDSRAVEKVYTTFYHYLKKDIEKTAPKGIRGINKQLSELIPINNAVIRRMPVAERNNALSLTDSIGLYATVFDPRAIAAVGLNKLSKSGKFANILTKAGERMSKPTSAFGRRFIGEEAEKLRSGIKKLRYYK